MKKPHFLFCLAIGLVWTTSLFGIPMWGLAYRGGDSYSSSRRNEQREQEQRQQERENEERRENNSLAQNERSDLSGTSVQEQADDNVQRNEEKKEDLPLSLIAFQEAVEVAPRATRFILQLGESGTWSIIAQEVNSVSQMPAAIRSENIAITRAFQRALEIEAPEINFSDLFVVNPLRAIREYPPLSAEKIRTVLQIFQIRINRNVVENLRLPAVPRISENVSEQTGQNVVESKGKMDREELFKRQQEIAPSLGATDFRRANELWRKVQEISSKRREAVINSDHATEALSKCRAALENAKALRDEKINQKSTPMKVSRRARKFGQAVGVLDNSFFSLSAALESVATVTEEGYKLSASREAGVNQAKKENRRAEEHHQKTGAALEKEDDQVLKMFSQAEQEEERIRKQLEEQIVEEAKKLLPPSDQNREAWKEWAKQVSQELGKSNTTTIERLAEEGMKDPVWARIKTAQLWKEKIEQVESMLRDLESEEHPDRKELQRLKQANEETEQWLKDVQEKKEKFRIEREAIAERNAICRREVEAARKALNEKQKRREKVDVKIKDLSHADEALRQSTQNLKALEEKDKSTNMALVAEEETATKEAIKQAEERWNKEQEIQLKEERTALLIETHQRAWKENWQEEALKRPQEPSLTDQKKKEEPKKTFSQQQGSFMKLLQKAKEAVAQDVRQIRHLTPVEQEQEMRQLMSRRDQLSFQEKELFKQKKLLFQMSKAMMKLKKQLSEKEKGLRDQEEALERQKQALEEEAIRLREERKTLRENSEDQSERERRLESIKLQLQSVAEEKKALAHKQECIEKKEEQLEQQSQDILIREKNSQQEKEALQEEAQNLREEKQALEKENHSLVVALEQAMKAGGTQQEQAEHYITDVLKKEEEQEVIYENNRQVQKALLKVEEEDNQVTTEALKQSQKISNQRKEELARIQQRLQLAQNALSEPLEEEDDEQERIQALEELAQETEALAKSRAIRAEKDRNLKSRETAAHKKIAAFRKVQRLAEEEEVKERERMVAKKEEQASLLEELHRALTDAKNKESPNFDLKYAEELQKEIAALQAKLQKDSTSSHDSNSDEEIENEIENTTSSSHSSIIEEAKKEQLERKKENQEVAELYTQGGKAYEAQVEALRDQENALSRNDEATAAIPEDPKSDKDASFPSSDSKSNEEEGKDAEQNALLKQEKRAQEAIKKAERLCVSCGSWLNMKGWENNTKKILLACETAQQESEKVSELLAPILGPKNKSWAMEERYTKIARVYKEAIPWLRKAVEINSKRDSKKNKQVISLLNKAFDQARVSISHYNRDKEQQMEDGDSMMSSAFQLSLAATAFEKSAYTSVVKAKRFYKKLYDQHQVLSAYYQEVAKFYAYGRAADNYGERGFFDHIGVEDSTTLLWDAHDAIESAIEASNNKGQEYEELYYQQAEQSLLLAAYILEIVKKVVLGSDEEYDFFNNLGLMLTEGFELDTISVLKIEVPTDLEEAFTARNDSNKQLERLYLQKVKSSLLGVEYHRKSAEACEQQNTKVENLCDKIYCSFFHASQYFGFAINAYNGIEELKALDHLSTAYNGIEELKALNAKDAKMLRSKVRKSLVFTTKKIIARPSPVVPRCYMESPDCCATLDKAPSK